MYSILLELADNGIIKTVEDDNYNGIDKLNTTVKVYELHESLKDTVNFLHELSLELGLYIGNSKEKFQLKYLVDWGDEYVPTEIEIRDRIKILKTQIKKLESTLAQNAEFLKFQNK